MAEFLELHHLNKTYGTVVKTPALRDVSLSVKKGEMVAIIGQSGSGKSTLLNMIGVLDHPDTGETLFEDRNLYTLGDDELAHFRNDHLGFVFQFHHLLPEFTALENVLIPYRLARGRATADAVTRAKELLARVGVADRMDNRAVNLSGGQQQRVAIARALMNKPDILLADEPTGNLDSDSGETVLTLLREINKQESVTFIVVTHDRHIAARCDRVVEMADGRIISDLSVTDKEEAEAWNHLSPCYCRLRQKGVNPRP